MLIFDIETGPLPADELKALCPPFDDSKFQPSEFDPASVKVGNLGEEKAKAKIEDARKFHEIAQTHLATDRELAEARHLEDFINRAALSPATGRVEAIGVLNGATNAAGILSGDECDILSSFWAKVEKCSKEGRKLIGHNIHGFDIPFLIRRSWFHEIDVPMSLLFNGRYPNDRLFVDTMTVWGCGNYRDSISLDNLAKAFGYPGKPDGITGADFSRLWRGTAEERQQAEAYLLNDLQMTATVARRMQIF